MIKKLISRLKGATMNEKLMYSLIILFIIGIIIRWDFISKEAGEAFGNIFTAADTTATKDSLEGTPFKVPEPPITITMPADKQAWIVENMWGQLDKSDTTLIGSTELKDAFAVWAMFLRNTPREAAARQITTTYKSLEEYKAMHNEFIRLGEGYFGDPNSQLRDDALFLTLLDYMIKSEALSDIEKIRPEELRKMTMKNQVGEKAANLKWEEPSKKHSSLYRARTFNALILFYTPGCHTCAALFEQINSNEVIMNMVSQGKLSLFALYADEDRASWEEYQKKIAPEWINGILDESFHTDEPYAIRATPSMYLLDSGGRVVIRDGGSVEGILAALDNLKAHFM